MPLVGILMIFLGALSSCSTKKNTAATRNYQAFITRYNIYFNGDEHYKKTLQTMENSYEDDYSTRLFLHPVEAKDKDNMPQPTGDFTRSIEKAQKAIQLRTIKKRPQRKAGKGNDPAYKEWMKREEYNPFLHNAWMMMGRSQYFNGDFLGAASTFFYVTKHFKWLPATVTEANLWMARSYCAIDWLFEAETILNRIKPDEDLTNNTLKELYYFTCADWAVRSNEDSKAIDMLKQAISYSSGSQKTRLTFLLGQIYARNGQKQAAYEAFKKAGNNGSASYRTKFNARIKQSEVFEGSDIRPEVKALERMTHYDRNEEYLDQIYYAIGNLYLSRKDTANAIVNYVKAADKSTRNGIDKAISQLTLGGLYYDLHEYKKAQPCYSEAISIIPRSYPDYVLLKRRSDVLDELALYAENVETQDSLLRLAAMTPEQRLAVIEKIIAELKKQEKEQAEAAAREAYLADQSARGNGLQQMGNAQQSNSFVLNSDNSWYFYNTATRNAGRTDFQKRWGSRKLEDDWRRRNKNTYSMTPDEETDSSDSDTEESQENEKTQEEQDHENDPHYPEYYLKQIPQDETQIANSNEVIQEGLFNMGLILKDKLYDYPAARLEFDRLLARYPDNIYRLDTYYNLYMMAVRDGNEAVAEHWRKMIVAEFPDSPYGQAMRNPDYFANLRATFSRQESLYARTYEDYLADRHEAVHNAYKEMEDNFPMSDLIPKFMFLDALTYVTENKPEQFGNVLTELLQRYPDADVAELASGYLSGLKSGRKLHSSGTNARGMIWSTRLSNDSTAMDDDGPLEFDLSGEGPHLLVMLYQRDKVSANQLLYDVARYNFSAYMVRDFDLEQMNFGNLGLLIIKGFNNSKEANLYRTSIEESSDLQLPEGVIPVGISQGNFDMLLSRGRSFEEYFDAVNDDRLRLTHEEVLPPDEYPSAEELYDDTPSPDINSEEMENHSYEESPEEAQPKSEPQEQLLIDEQEQSPVTEPNQQPEVVPETEPDANPEQNPVTTPEQKPVTKPEQKPVTVPERKPEQKPETKPEQKPEEKPNLTPTYPEGSEGDDDDLLL